MKDSPSAFLSFQIPQSTNHAELEVFLQKDIFFHDYDEVEVTLSYYPYQKGLKADHFHFDPYEDYVIDLADGRRSTYQMIHSVAGQSFGILLGVAIFSYFFTFYPQLLLSVESVVSIFAAYTFGKEIWIDVDEVLQKMTNSWRVRWTQQSFYYVLQQFGTLQRFWQLARQNRYGYEITLPAKIDFISHSNSKTIEMMFHKKDLQQSREEKIRVLSVKFDQSTDSNVAQRGLLIARIGLVKRLFGISQTTEFYQSVDGQKIGTLDLENTWHQNMSLQKMFVSIGRLVWFWRTARLSEQGVISLRYNV